MQRVIDQSELRISNEEILDAVSRGDSFIVTRNGEPVAELRPILNRRRHVVAKPEVIATFAHGPCIDARRLRTDLDRVVDPDVI